MSFLSVLGKVLHVGEALAPEVATAINPAAGALVGLVVNAVTQAEQTGGTGAAKKEQVIKSVTPAALAIVSTVLQAKGGGTNINAPQLTASIGSLVDGVVALLNSVQTQAAATAAPAAPAPAAPSPGTK